MSVYAEGVLILGAAYAPFILQDKGGIGSSRSKSEGYFRFFFAARRYVRRCTARDALFFSPAGLRGFLPIQLKELFHENVTASAVPSTPAPHLPAGSPAHRLQHWHSLRLGISAEPTSQGLSALHWCCYSEKISQGSQEMRPDLKKNPLSVIKLASYDLTEKGRFTENLELLSAMKTAQASFLHRIVRLHPDQVKRSDAIRDCGKWIFFRRYATGERLFAGGYICRSPFCLPCAFRRAYVMAQEISAYIRALVSRNPALAPVLLLHSAAPCAGGLSDQYASLKRYYRKYLKSRRFMPYIYGSISGYYLFPCSDCSEPTFSVKELLLIDTSQPGSAYPPEIGISPQNLFSAVLDVLLCSVVNSEGNLTRDQHFDAVQVRTGSAPFIPYGCFTKYVPPSNVSSDQPDDRLVDQPFVEEQYLYEAGLMEYVLQQVNVGDDMQFPFDNHRKAGLCSHKRRALASRELKRRQFLRSFGGHP